MSSGMGKVVCVTGASGYIASWLVKLLLHRGYTVRAIVRDTGQHVPPHPPSPLPFPSLSPVRIPPAWGLGLVGA
ncbi:hypothetical protein ZWY2020_033872 [Hordeum vulgare]|nr:hypothetical protein ZWY2020_033872 [Hordeum vulgare]